MRLILLTVLTFLSLNSLHAQMWSEALQDTLYGNEWIDFEHSDRYYKIELAEDGIYRIPKSVIPSAASAVPGSDFRLYYMGQQVPLYSTSTGTLGNTDYLQFYGQKNRTQLDEYLFPEGQEMLNPDYSLFTDTSAYYLTWDANTTGLNFTEVPNNLNDLPAPESYFTYTEKKIESANANKMKLRAGNVSLEKSYFDNGEGFGKSFNNNSDYTHTFALTGITNDLSPVLNLRYAGTNNVNHLQNISINGELIETENFDGYEFRNIDNTLPTLGENAALQIDALPPESASNLLIIGSASITYSRAFNFGGADFFLFNLPAGNNEKYLEISNFSGQNAVFLYDLTNNLRINVNVEQGLAKVVLPASETDRNLVLIEESTAVKTITSLTQVEFIDYSDSDAEFIILSNPELYFDENGINQVQRYAEHRSNDYLTEIVDINQLYEQFAYGLKRSPMSVKNFAYFTKKNNDAAQFFFLVGNAREYHESRTSEQLESAALFLPTYGRPGADNLLFSPNNRVDPLFSIGRLTAQSGTDIRHYLDKVIETEDTFDNPQTIEDRLWMKNILHLGGGGSDAEQSSIRSFLENMSLTLQYSQYGAIPNSFYKTASDVIDESPRTAIENLVNSGVSILNFFGHSSPSGFDFPIQDPSEYNNQGRYFLMISNGCFSGRCHRDINGIGEEFLFAPNRGAVMYYASNGYGYVSALNAFTNSFYDKLGNEMYGRSVGEIFRQIVSNNNASIESGYNGGNLLAQQNTLQGDPAVKLYPHEGMDLTLDGASVAVQPNLINTQLDSFEFNVDIVNIGKFIADSVDVNVKLQYPNGTTGYETVKRVPTPQNRRVVSLNIPIIDTEDIIGLNTVYAKVDSGNEAEELPASAEFNNELRRESGELGIEVLIVSNDVLPIFPKEFSITNDEDLELIASTVDVFAEEQNFILQIDTTADFNSPLFLEKIITQSGGLLKWRPNLTFENDVVYYWRSAPETLQDETPRWNSSSFLFLNEAEDGWNQPHYFQFTEDEYNFKRIDESRKFEYVEDFKEINIENGVSYVPGAELLRPCVLVNSSPIHCGTHHFDIQQGIKFWVLDSLTLLPLPDYNNIAYGNPRNFFSFDTAIPERLEAATIFLRDSIETGNYVAFLTIQRTPNHDFQPQNWTSTTAATGTDLFTLLEAEGSDIVRDLETTGSQPYAFFFKKGYPDQIGGESSLPSGQIIDNIYNAAAAYDRGKAFSPPIGPATEWNTFIWDTAEEVQDFEINKFNIYGLQNNGTRDTLFADVTDNETDLSDISVEMYPHLQLEWITKDSVSRTPPQLANWRVLYQGVPEAALNPQIAYEITSDTIAQGQTFNLKIGVENISPYDMDSLLISYISNDVNNQGEELSLRGAPLLAGDSLVAEVDLSSKDLSKLTSLLIDVNPAFDQVEETRVNNTGLLNFYVKPDRENPILDVTFDGVHILNGDIVSPTPQIVMSFTDENQYLAMEDTSQFRLIVEYPDRSEKRIYFNQADVVFIPADATNLNAENKATIEYAPEFTQDGVYTLKLEGTDATGNRSGDSEYNIEFEIITKSMISNVLNYPNPFSTSTRFVYTLTGNEPPAFFKIQIMTVSGRIVREITQNELGEMKIGTHQTDFVWDGTDEFGDKLANGVYLYRVIARNAQNEDIEQYQTEADKFFNQGFGKMVIVR